MQQHRRHALAAEVAVPVGGGLVGREPVAGAEPGAADPAARSVRHGGLLAAGAAVGRALVDELVGLARRHAGVEGDGGAAPRRP